MLNSIPTIQAVQVEHIKETVEDEIRSLHTSILSAKIKVKQKREDLKDKLAEDNEYRKVSLEVESLSDRRKELRKILADTHSDVTDLTDQIKGINSTIKELKGKLSGRLEQYHKMTQLSIFDGMKIVKNYSLSIK